MHNRKGTTFAIRTYHGGRSGGVVIGFAMVVDVCWPSPLCHLAHTVVGYITRRLCMCQYTSKGPRLYPTIIRHQIISRQRVSALRSVSLKSSPASSQGRDPQTENNPYPGALQKTQPEFDPHIRVRLFDETFDGKKIGNITHDTIEKQ